MDLKTTGASVSRGARLEPPRVAKHTSASHVSAWWDEWQSRRSGTEGMSGRLLKVEHVKVVCA